MKNRATLTMMEQIIMILVISVSTAVCLRLFAGAENISEKTQVYDGAVLNSGNVAEILKNTCGDFSKSAEILGGQNSGDTLTANFDVDGETILITAVKSESGIALLGSAEITAERSGEVLCTLNVCWQES